MEGTALTQSCVWPKNIKLALTYFGNVKTSSFIVYGACGVMVTIVGNRQGNQSSKPGPGCLYSCCDADKRKIRGTQKGW